MRADMPFGEWECVATPVEAHYEDAGLYQSVTYYYYVVVIDRLENRSAYSQLASATTMTPVVLELFTKGAD